MPRPCAIHTCANSIPDTAHETTVYCRLCRGSIYTWMKRSAGRILARKAALAKYTERMSKLELRSEEKPRGKK